MGSCDAWQERLVSMTQQTTERFVDRETWLEERKAFLIKEKEFTKQHEELSAERRKLPLVKIDKDYLFDTDRGKESLHDLFKGKSQLLVYHFMFGPEWQEACPSCSFWMDNFNGTDIHLAARDISLIVISRAPLKKLQAYKKRMGWTFDLVSSGMNDFNLDFGVHFPEGDKTKGEGYNYDNKIYAEELPGISVFKKSSDASIGHFYSTFGRGLDIFNCAYHLIDATPIGRNETELTYPQAWVRRKDQYK